VRKRGTLLGTLVLVLYASPLLAQTSSGLALIHERLQDWHTMARLNGFVFVGEIATMRPVRTHRCRSGFEEKLEYIVRDLYWSDPDAYVRDGYVVGKGFVDCTQKPLPAPLKEGDKVIALCGVRLGSYSCLRPVPATSMNINRVQQWVAELRSRQGDPVLLLVHGRLLEDAELIRKSDGHAKGTFTVNGEAVRPLVFSGTVAFLSPISRIARVKISRMMDISISSVLFGDEAERQIRVTCRSDKCAGATVGAKVVGYCRMGQRGAQDCLISTSSPEREIPRLKDWVVEAGLGTQEGSW